MNPLDSERLATLWAKSQPTVTAYILALIPDFHQAEDVLQQVAVASVRKFSTYDFQQPFIPWVLGVARLEVLKHRRTFARDRLVLAPDLIDEIAVVYQQMHPELEEHRRLLRKCLNEAKGRAREALQLRYADELRPAQIAERLAMTPEAVRVLLHRARGAIGQCIRRRLAGGER